MMSVDEAKPVRDLITDLFESGQFEEGLKRLRDIGHLPRAVELECLGNMHFYKRELQAAIERYEAAISIDPDYTISRYQYLVGTQDEKRSDLVAAFNRYQAAIGIEPTFVDAYIELGGLLVKVGDFNGAAQCYRDAVKLLPNDLAVWHNLKTVLTRLESEEPGHYGDELAEVEVAYAQLEKSGASLPENRKW